MTDCMQHSAHRYFCRFVLLFLSLGFVFIPEAFSFAITLDRVLASVNNEIITFADYKEFVQGLGQTEQSDDVDSGLLNQLVEERILLLEARAKGIEVSDGEVEKEVEELRSQNGVSKEGFEDLLARDKVDITTYKRFMKNRMIISRLISREVDAMVVVTDAEMKTYYRENRKDYIEWPEAVDLKAIFMKLEEHASITELTDLKLKSLRIVSQLREGGNFEKLVEEYSDEPVKSQEGILGRFARGKLIPPLDKVAFSLPEGEVSDPVWVSEGVYILKLVHRIPETFQQFDTVKEDIHGRLFQQKRERLFHEWIKKLWEKSAVKLN